MINHERIILACGLFDAGNVTSEDTVYTALPLYHSSALLIGVHGCIMKGTMHLSSMNERVTVQNSCTDMITDTVSLSLATKL